MTRNLKFNRSIYYRPICLIFADTAFFSWYGRIYEKVVLLFVPFMAFTKNVPSENVSSPDRSALRKLLVPYLNFNRCSSEHQPLKLKQLGNFERRIHFSLDETMLHSHRYPSVKFNLDSLHICMVKMQFQNGKNSHFVHRVTCSVHVDCGTEHMVGRGRRIATRIGVKSSSDFPIPSPNRKTNNKLYFEVPVPK